MRCENARKADHRCGSAGVINSAVVDVIAVDRAADTQMIIMSHEDYYFVCHRGAGQDADDVGACELAISLFEIDFQFNS